MEIHNISKYRASKNFIKQAPILLQRLEEFDKMLVNYCIYPPIYKLLQIVRDTKLIVQANVKIAENTIQNKGKLK